MISYSLKNFTFGFNPDKLLFDKVDQDFKKNELVIVTGKNGAGKSTLCRLLTGLLKGYEGELISFDKDFQTIKPAELMSNMIFIKQDLVGNVIGVTPDEDLKVWQNRFSEKDNPDKEVKRDEALHSMDLLRYREEPVWNLSFGLKRRVMLAALPLFPEKYWVVDEPIAGLDVKGIDLFLELLKRKKEQSTGGIFVTHRGDLFKGIADRHLNLDSGKFEEVYSK
ncbi:MAG: ATP-binding cassette domain-containing protein [Candidatus Cloacimonas sp.]|nr:ATP-binding cassette domain-containing protein [Candidatus Cloacimonadota bacterium]